MKAKLFVFLAGVAAWTVTMDPAFGRGLLTSGRSPHTLAVGGRYHTDNSVYTDLPFGDGDLSYDIAYEYSDKSPIIWQFGLDYAPDVSGTRDAASDGAGAATNGTDFVLTPQFNLLAKDNYFVGGAGILGSYIRDDQKNGEWLSPYWQMQLGLEFPLMNNLSVNASAYYVLENWGDITEFTFGDLEYGGWLKYRF